MMISIKFRAFNVFTLTERKRFCVKHNLKPPRNKTSCFVVFHKMSNTSSLVLQTLKLKNPKLLLLESSSTTLTHFKTIHSYMIRTHTIFDVFSVSRLITFTIDNKLLDYALKLFNQIQNPNLFIYNAMIRGFSGSKSPERSFLFYVGLRRASVFPDNLTYPFLIKACTQMGWVRSGVQVHGQVIRCGFCNDVYVESSLVNMYASLGDAMSASCVFGDMSCKDVVSWSSMIAGYNKCGDVVSARDLFDRMPVKNLVTWSAMISGYARNGFFDKAIELYRLMQSEGVMADETVMSSVISSCAHLGALELGEELHDYVVRNKMTVNLILGTALVDMYARCGNINKAMCVFEEIQGKDVLSWTALISGFAMHGYAEKALEYFKKMVETGITPTDITFTAVLSACSHGGLVEHGLEIFDSMKGKYGIEPRLEHYGCVVDLLGRAGKLVEAEKFVLEMPVKPNAPIWGALLGACRIHKNAEVAERVGKILIELQPENSSFYVLLSNIYARTDKWMNAEKTRHIMKEKRVKKPPGHSLIEIDGIIHNFRMGDKAHPEIT